MLIASISLVLSGKISEFFIKYKDVVLDIWISI